MNRKNVLLITGVILIMISPVISFIIVPSMKKLPDDFNQTLIFEGKLGIFNESTLEMRYTDVEIIRHVKAIENKEGVMLLRENISIFDKNNKKEFEELATSKIIGIDPYSSENIEGYGDLDRIGQFIFPVGVEKKNYLLWNNDLDDSYQQGYITPKDASFPVYYRTEEDIKDIATYKFHGWQNDVFIGHLSEMPDVNLFYSTEQILWSEKSTGAIVNLYKHWQHRAVFPDLHVIPDNLNLSIDMDGKLWILLRGRKDIVMNREIKVEDTYMQNGEKILFMKDETITYNSKTGERIDVACKNEYHDVNAITGEEVKNYNEDERQGIYLFPPGTKKKDYLLWNIEINVPSIARFIKTEEYDGLQTYVFGINEDKLLYDSSPGIERNVRYITNTRYWVEPTTGYIIDMEKESKKKINPLYLTFGVRGVFWFDIYRLSLSFTSETVNKNIEDASLFMRQIQDLSGSKVIVVDLEYWMSEKSITESVEEAGQSSLLIFFLRTFCQ